nr:immunoglobulin heavy chain junction region [Mus musculus]
CAIWFMGYFDYW